MNLRDFWINGLMPGQFLGLFVAIFCALLCGQVALRRFGYRVTGLWQGVVIWLAGVGTLQFVSAAWLLPESLMLQYAAAITVATFLYVSSDAVLWAECKRSVFALFTGETKPYWVLRALLFITVPLSLAMTMHQNLIPHIERPLESGAYHPAPPRSITVHGVQYDLQTTKNPFRVGEGLREPDQ